MFFPKNWVFNEDERFFLANIQVAEEDSKETIAKRNFQALNHFLIQTQNLIYLLLLVILQTWSHL